MKLKNSIILIVLTLFIFQWVAQSIPHHETVTVGGEEVCTCGCGHTAAICAKSHESLSRSNSDCSCEHQQTKTSQLIFSPNKIADMELSSFEALHISGSQPEILVEIRHLFSSIIIDIPKPPPQTAFC